jgi:uncharacterized coiled-coil DUF342 family protein
MTISAEAIVGVVTLAVAIVVWALRLEGKVKRFTERLDECQAHRDDLIEDGRQTKHEINKKLDDLLRSVGKIEGQLSLVLNGRKGRAK